MAPLTIDFDKILATSDVIDQVFLWIQLASELIGVGYFQLAAEINFSSVWLQLSQQDLHQSGFAGTVGSDDSHTVSPLDNGGDILQHAQVAEAFVHVL